MANSLWIQYVLHNAVKQIVHRHRDGGQAKSAHDANECATATHDDIGTFARKPRV
jgi:hypothetical protein